MNNYLMNVNQKTKIDFYSNKKYKLQLLDKLKTDDNILNKKIDILKCDLGNGFILYDKPNLLRFIQGHNEIEDFAEQFVKLYYYRENNNKFANSQELYKILYGETIGQQNWNKKIEQVTGKNNPWYNHGGKYSPLSEKSIVHSEQERINAKEKIKETKKDPARRSNKTIEYWHRKGYFGAEAERELKQAIEAGTFTLAKCIAKYGNEDGTKIWKDRQDKWQNTLNSKSQEEKDDINRRKSSGIGRYLDRNLPGKLYYIRFHNKDVEFWKIGITSIDVINGRFKSKEVFLQNHKLNMDIIFIKDYKTIQEAYSIEQHILRNNNSYRITTDYNDFYTTETFNRDILKEINEIITIN